MRAAFLPYLAWALPLVLALAACQPPAPTVDIQRIEDQRIEGSAELIDALGSGSSEQRARAALAMGRIQSPSYSAALATAVSDTDPVVRRASLFALGQLGLARGVTPPADAVAAVRVALADGDAELVALAVEALGKLSPEGAEAKLVEELSSPSPAVRAAAALGLFRVRFAPVWRGQVEQAPEWSEGARAALRTALADSEVAVRRGAVHAFSRYGDEGSVAELGARLDDVDEWVRLWAVRALGRSGAPAAALAPAFVDASPRVRAEAVLAANRLEAGAEVPLALAMDDSFHVRTAAATALGPRTDASSLGALEGLSADPSVTVRSAAVAALTRRLGEGMLERLETLAADEDWRVRSTAAHAAGSLGEAGRPIVLALFEDADTRVRTAALEALGEMGGAQDAIAAALGAGDLAVRGTAVQLVPGAAFDDAAALLDDAYASSSGDAWTEVREGVVDALAEVEGGEPVLRRIAAEDAAPSVRARARTALEGLGVELPAPADTPPAPEPSPYLGVTFERDPLVAVETTRGELRIRVYAAAAPIHAAHFVDLVEKGFYDGLIWHRVVPNFVVQGGDPRGDGWGSGDVTLRDEIHPGAFERGSVGMPKAGKDTGGCQLFITHLPTPHLDGNYTIFGQVEDGLDVIDALEVGDRIVRARVVER